jgi:hypothetical protein
MGNGTMMKFLLAGLFPYMAVAQAQVDEADPADGTLDSLEHRLMRLERAIGHADTPLVTYESEKGAVQLQSLEWGLLLEAEGSYSRLGGESTSDLILATAEFSVEAVVNDWIEGHVCLLYEEDDTEENNLDTAHITVGKAFYVQAGKFYLPFGNFESVFVSDPLTLELAEINRSSILVGYGNPWLGVSAGVFKGDFQGDGEAEDNIRCGYAAVGVAPNDFAEFGLYWLSDLMETDGLADLNDNLGQRESGAGAYANFHAGRFFVNAEVVSALADYSIAGGSYTPMAYNIEVSASVGEKWRVGAKVEGSRDFHTEFDGTTLGGKMPGTNYGLLLSYAFHENAAVSAEYLHQRELADGEDGDLVTLQLALEI